LLESIVEAWQPFAARKSVKLALKIAQAVPCTMQADPKRQGKSERAAAVYFGILRVDGNKIANLTLSSVYQWTQVL